MQKGASSAGPFSERGITRTMRGSPVVDDVSFLVSRSTRWAGSIKLRISTADKSQLFHFPAQII
jgi:hypothetical protein